MQGTQPSNVIYTAFKPNVTDGGKARIKARRLRMFLGEQPERDVADDQLMREADTASSEYCAPTSGPA